LVIFLKFERILEKEYRELVDIKSGENFGRAICQNREKAVL
jgi:hypothetical protein